MPLHGELNSGTMSLVWMSEGAEVVFFFLSFFFLPNISLVFVWFLFAFNNSFGLNKAWMNVGVWRRGGFGGCLWLLVDRWQALAWSSFDQLHLVQNFEWRWKWLSLESTKETWKGVSAQVVTRSVCDLCVTAVCRESSCPNSYLHSQITRANSFSWPCIFGGPFLCPNPRCGWNLEMIPLWETYPQHSLVCFTTAVEQRDRFPSHCCVRTEWGSGKICLASKLSWFLNWYRKEKQTVKQVLWQLTALHFLYMKSIFK